MESQEAKPHSYAFCRLFAKQDGFASRVGAFRSVVSILAFTVWIVDFGPFGQEPRFLASWLGLLSWLVESVWTARRYRGYDLRIASTMSQAAPAPQEVGREFGSGDLRKRSWFGVFLQPHILVFHAALILGSALLLVILR